MKSALEKAVEDFHGRYVIGSRPAPVGSVILCSGGIATDPDAPPLLCLTRDLAIEHWVASMDEFIWQKADELDLLTTELCLRLAEEPGIYRYEITMQHESGHRIAAERFAVICRVWIGTLADGETLPAEQPVKKDVER